MFEWINTQGSGVGPSGLTLDADTVPLQKSGADEPDTKKPPEGGFFSLHTNQIRIRNWAVIMRPSDVETTWSWLLGPHAGWPAPPHTVGTAPGRDPELLA